ncbi:hypothetical protein [Xanthomonas campestris]|uniref:hypothetical protein n=1 Tax=Xanthomonas campestris TaxID=339 RepID=UPI0023682B9D|nr:hypothetical protein [Xanthomonas campestris]
MIHPWKTTTMRRNLIVLVVLGTSACLAGCAALQDLLRDPRPGPAGFVTVSCTSLQPDPAQPCEQEALQACSDTAIRQLITARSSPNMVPIFPDKRKSKNDGKDNRKDRNDEQSSVEQRGYDIRAEYQCYLTKPQPWDSGYTPSAR